MVVILVADGDAAVWIVPVGTAGKFRPSISPAEVLFFGVFLEDGGQEMFFFTVADATREDF